MLPTRFTLAETSSREDAIDGILHRNGGSFHGLDAGRRLNWHNLHREVSLGCVSLSYSICADLRYRSYGLDDIVFSMALSGHEEVSVGSLTRRIQATPTLLPRQASVGRIANFQGLTLRVHRAALTAHLEAAGFSSDVCRLVHHNWLTPFTNGTKESEVILSIFRYVCSIDHLLPSEERAIEGLLLAQIGRLLMPCDAPLKLRAANMRRNRHADDPIFPLPWLSPREHQTLHLLSQGRSYGEIALGMGVSLWAVQTYAKKLYQKLGVRSAIAAVQLGRSNGLLNAEPAPRHVGRTGTIRCI